MFAVKPVSIHRNNHISYQLRSHSQPLIKRSLLHRAFNVGGDHINEENINALQTVIVNNSYILGKYIGYIVLFTAVLNWITYRRIRKFMDDDETTKK
jgi:hypothetical protein